MKPIKPTSESVLTPDEIFAAKSARPHSYYQKNNLSQCGEGKQLMHDEVERLVLRNFDISDDRLRFMSLPGKFWRFEFRLQETIKKQAKRTVIFTGFERDPNVILAGRGYVPHSKADEHPVKPGFRKFNALGVEYFRTNLARWISMDVNSALTLHNGLFKEKDLPSLDMKKRGCNTGMELWLHKFCMWDAVWLDFYGPVSDKIGEALANLHFHCRQDRTPVAVTVMKGRENDTGNVESREAWLADKLGGAGRFPGTQFKTLNYFEYSDGGSTMCNILGVIKR